MRYISTRGGGQPLPFCDTVLTGLARDGGLFLPQSVPNVSDRLKDWSRMSYADLACAIIGIYADDLPSDVIRQMVDRSYATFRQAEVTPVVSAGPVHILELFHGPTLAFKDIALQFLGNLFEIVLAQRGGELNIVAATSGDTGSAAIQGMRGRQHMRIFVLHPQGRVSPVQERQMTSVLDANVHNIAIDGTFDDCQDIVKSLFNDLAFRDRYHLGAVNSINWARVLAQIVYYFYAAFRVMETTGAKQVRFSVPTGNFGDVFAGWMASKMGLPIDRLVLATNENDILARFFATGVYETAKQVVPTQSPSMDIQVASNFERYLYDLAHGDAGQLCAWMDTFKRTGRLSIPGAQDPKSIFRAGRADTAETLATIRDFWTQYHYLLDPHTAVGVHVGMKHLDRSTPMICLATAHPAKFGDAIRQATGSDLAHHPILDALTNLPTRMTRLPAQSKAVAEVVAQAIASS